MVLFSTIYQLFTIILIPTYGVIIWEDTNTEH